MKERPILFSGAMVLAILDGRKTQTRRVVKRDWWEVCESGAAQIECNDAGVLPCPYGAPGDRLWVRETWKPDRRLVPVASGYASDLCGAAFKADDGFRHVFDIAHHFGADWGNETRWRPSIFMPRWASRITLEIVAVRVERVRNISRDDAIAEGVSMPGPMTSYPQEQFRLLWDSINAARGYAWDANPWVWVITFRREG